MKAKIEEFLRDLERETLEVIQSEDEEVFEYNVSSSSYDISGEYVRAQCDTISIVNKDICDMTFDGICETDAQMNANSRNNSCDTEAKVYFNVVTVDNCQDSIDETGTSKIAFDSVRVNNGHRSINTDSDVEPSDGEVEENCNDIEEVAEVEIDVTCFGNEDVESVRVYSGSNYVNSITDTEATDSEIEEDSNDVDEAAGVDVDSPSDLMAYASDTKYPNGEH